MLDPGHAAIEQTEPEADDPSTQDTIDDIGEEKGKHQAAHSSKDQPGNEPTAPGTPNPIIRSSNRVLPSATMIPSVRREESGTSRPKIVSVGNAKKRRMLTTERSMIPATRRAPIVTPEKREPAKYCLTCAHDQITFSAGSISPFTRVGLVSKKPMSPKASPPTTPNLRTPSTAAPTLINSLNSSTRISERRRACSCGSQSNCMW